MSVYSVKGRGWRYDFTLNGIRHTEAWFKTKAEAKMAEAKKREEVLNPDQEAIQKGGKTPTDISFLDLINLRLDFVRVYNSKTHYRDYVYMARRWTKLWGKRTCRQISQTMVERYLQRRRKAVSPYTVNQELKYLRAVFNWGKKRSLIKTDPTAGIPFLPVTKSIKYVPPVRDIYKVIAAAVREEKDYLWLILHTMGRVSEINRLTWDDIDLENRMVTLYTRKKRGGDFTPRRVPMTDRVYEILSRMDRDRDQTKPWIFWHTYWSSKTGEKKNGPYADRKRLMKTLCARAGVKYFRFHALRHAGATILDNSNVPIGVIQRILGHENRKTTEIYLHSIGQAEREAMAILQEAEEKVSHRVSHRKEKGLRLVS